jgi:hypothetical protein
VTQHLESQPVSESLARSAASWRFVISVPPRYVFAAMEQATGTPPFRYEVTGADSARIIEAERKHFLFGNWRPLDRGEDGAFRQRRFVRARRWVTCRAVSIETGTEVAVEASRGRGAVPRGLQLVELLSRGPDDRRSIYRDRTIPPGPVTLVASWAGTRYQLFERPAFGATRGEGVLTATPLEAIAQEGAFVQVRTADGRVGWIERDQLVPAPAEATREAQVRTAVYG